MEISRGAVPFRSPEPLRAVFRLPHRGDVEGMLVPRGVTVIVGGGYHGKFQHSLYVSFVLRLMVVAEFLRQRLLSCVSGLLINLHASIKVRSPCCAGSKTFHCIRGLNGLK